MSLHAANATLSKRTPSPSSDARLLARLLAHGLQPRQTRLRILLALWRRRRASLYFATIFIVRLLARRRTTPAPAPGPVSPAPTVPMPAPSPQTTSTPAAPAPTRPDLKVIKRKQEAGEEVNAAKKPKETTHPSPTHNPIKLTFPQGWGSICDSSYPPGWGSSIPSSPPFSFPLISLPPTPTSSTPLPPPIPSLPSFRIDYPSLI